VKYRVLTSVRSLRTPDGTIVLDINQGRMFTLDPLASRILAMLEDGSTNEESLLAAIKASFYDIPETASSDLHEFLQQLCSHRLIVADENAAESS